MAKIQIKSEKLSFWRCFFDYVAISPADDKAT